MINLLLDFLFPCYCVSCGEVVSSKENHLCGHCRENLRFAHNGCGRCGLPLDGEVCHFCSTREFYITKNISLFEYTGTVKKALHGLKFKRLKNIATIFPDYILSALDAINEPIDIVTFVPMSGKKKKNRGYNQSELIAKAVAKKRGLYFKKTLKEHKGHISQREFGYRERFINVIDRYSVIGKSNISGKAILIIDDVFTTGATINECARKLLEAGASKVFSITIARADIKKLENI